MLRDLKTKYTSVGAVVLFDSYDERGYDWRLDTSTSSYDAWREIAQDPYFNPVHR